MDICMLRDMLNSGAIMWTTHCLERMQERDIRRSEVKECILCGEIIEEYPDDFPNPSCLIYAIVHNNKVLHVVVGASNEYLFIITAYIPTTDKFEDDLKTRR